MKDIARFNHVLLMLLKSMCWLHLNMDLVLSGALHFGYTSAWMTVHQLAQHLTLSLGGAEKSTRPLQRELITCRCTAFNYRNDDI